LLKKASWSGVRPSVDDAIAMAEMLRAILWTERNADVVAMQWSEVAVQQSRTPSKRRRCPECRVG
jgi:hypothetical protein